MLSAEQMRLWAISASCRASRPGSAASRFGKTAGEALDRFDRFRRLEDAGAFACRMDEVIPAAVMAEIGAALVLLRSRSALDPMLTSFSVHLRICGEAARVPRLPALRAISPRRLRQTSARRAGEALSGFRAVSPLAAFSTLRLQGE